MTDAPTLHQYPLQTHEKLRYGDTDRQGHVNNAVFAVMLETGRVELLYDHEAPILEPGLSFVIARLEVDFIGEITWPGTVDIGTRVLKIGRSSVTLDQALFQHDRCVARAKSVVVLTNDETRRSHALSPAAVDHLSALVGPASDA